MMTDDEESDRLKKQTKKMKQSHETRKINDEESPLTQY